MMPLNHSFLNVQDSDTAVIGRLVRSADIRVLNRFEYFEAVNNKNGHRYRVHVAGLDLICDCPDSKKNICKHEIAVARDMPFFGVT